jgi:hypothetical protein
MPYTPDIPRHKGQFLPGPVRDVHARISDSESATTAKLLTLGLRISALEDEGAAAKLRDHERAQEVRARRASRNGSIGWALILLALGLAAITAAWRMGWMG